MAKEIVKMNEEDVLAIWAKAPKGTTLKLPENKTFEVTADTTVGEVAKETLGRSWKAPQVFELNKAILKKPAVLPPEAELNLPQPQWPTLIPFGCLILLLFIVGAGFVLRSPPEEEAPVPVQE